MTEPRSCAELRDDLAEVATGAASGPDRAHVLRHLADCDECRAELDELTRVADDVLLIARPHEPPAGFESAVLDRIAAERSTLETSEGLPPAGPEPAVSALASDSSEAGPSAVPTTDRRRRFARPVLIAASAVVLATAGAGVAWQVTESDRELAAAYRSTLDVADGRYFSAADLASPSGGSAGTVFFYEGDPSWLFVVVRDAADGSYDVIVESDAGTTTTASGCEVERGTGSAGATIDTRVYDIRKVMLRAEDGTTLTATVTD